MKINLSELAERFDLTLIGNAKHSITGVAPLEKATQEQLSFLANSKYTSHLNHTNAGVVVIKEGLITSFNGNTLIAKDPYVSFAKIASIFQNDNHTFTGIHNLSLIHI